MKTAIHSATLVLASLLCSTTACTILSTTSDLQPIAERRGEWERQEAALIMQIEQAQARYREDSTLEFLRGYEAAIRDYLDRGFALYRAYLAEHREPPGTLIASLDKRTSVLMDVADEYIKHGSLAVGEGIAADIVHEYSDLPQLSVAQRRAEAVLLRYRYRQDY